MKLRRRKLSPPDRVVDLTDHVVGHAWAAAVPAIVGGAGAVAQGLGGKKQGGGEAEIPGIYKQSVANALKSTGYGKGLPSYSGQMTAGMTPLQTGAIDFISRTLGQGEAGLQSAQNTIMSAATQGISPADIELARSQTEPLFNILKGNAQADLREQQAQGGRFFSTGALNEGSDLMSRMMADRQSQLLPLAMQMQQMRVGAAQGLPAFLLGQQGLGQGALQAGEAQRSLNQQDLNSKYQEFLRTGPQGVIQLLASLMGAAPMQQQAVAPNMLQILGSGASGLSQSPGFWQYMSQFGNQSAPQGYDPPIM